MKKTATVTFLAVIALIVSLTALIFSVSIFTGAIPINSQINNQNATPTISPTISPTNPMTSTPKPTAIPTTKPPQSTNVEPTKQPSPISTRLVIYDLSFSDRLVPWTLTAIISGNLTDQNGRGVTNATIIINAYANATQGWIKIGEGQTYQTYNSGYFSIRVSTYVKQCSQIQAIYYGDLNYKPCNTTVAYSSIPITYNVI